MNRHLSGILIPLISLLFILTTSCMGHSKMTTQQIKNHTGNSTVALIYHDEDNDDDDIDDNKTFCTGIWVDETHILTAYHCAKVEQKHLQAIQDKKEENRKECEGLMALFGQCDPDKKPEHKVIDLENLPIHVIQWAEVDQMGKEPTAQHLTKVVAWDADHDLVLLHAEGRAVPAHEVAELADKVPDTGEPVYVVGHPHGFYWTFLTGTVAGYRDIVPGAEGRGAFLQLQVPIYYGNSGGGAFDQYGRLIGMADRLSGLPAEGLFIPVETIRSFLRSSKSLETLEVLSLGK